MVLKNVTFKQEDSDLLQNLSPIVISIPKLRVTIFELVCLKNS